MQLWWHCRWWVSLQNYPPLLSSVVVVCLSINSHFAAWMMSEISLHFTLWGFASAKWQKSGSACLGWCIMQNMGGRNGDSFRYMVELIYCCYGRGNWTCFLAPSRCKLLRAYWRPFKQQCCIEYNLYIIFFKPVLFLLPPFHTLISFQVFCSSTQSCITWQQLTIITAVTSELK